MADDNIKSTWKDCKESVEYKLKDDPSQDKSLTSILKGSQLYEKHLYPPKEDESGKEKCLADLDRNAEPSPFESPHGKAPRFVPVFRKEKTREGKHDEESYPLLVEDIRRLKFEMKEMKKQFGRLCTGSEEFERAPLSSRLSEQHLQHQIEALRYEQNRKLDSVKETLEESINRKMDPTDSRLEEASLSVQHLKEKDRKTSQRIKKMTKHISSLESKLEESIKEQQIMKKEMENMKPSRTLRPDNEVFPLKERYSIFRNAARRQYPECVQGLELDSEQNKMNLYVSEDHDQTELEGFLWNFNDILPLEFIKIVEQPQPLLLMSPTLLASSNKEDMKLDAEGRCEITRGSSIFCIKQGDAETFKSDIESFLAQNLQYLPIWSVGYMMQDMKTKKHFLLTTIHSLMNIPNADKICGKHESDSLSFFTRYDNAEHEPQSVHLSNSAVGHFGQFVNNGALVGVDILAVPVSKNLATKHPVCFDFEEDGKQFSVEIYSGNIEDLGGTIVKKNSRTHAEQDTGIIENINPDLVIMHHGEEFENVIAVMAAPNSKMDSFAVKGDSGSLVYTVDKQHNTITLLGFVLSKWPVIYAKGKTFYDVTFLVTFKNCLSALKKGFDLDLQCIPSPNVPLNQRNIHASDSSHCQKTDDNLSDLVQQSGKEAINCSRKNIISPHITSTDILQTGRDKLSMSDAMNDYADGYLEQSREPS